MEFCRAVGEGHPHQQSGALSRNGETSGKQKPQQVICCGFAYSLTVICAQARTSSMALPVSTLRMRAASNSAS